ncbi:hypothetical protein CDL15_Pgr004756 [Punica granatum]|uniref:Uncharacterized protein n=1 Tax=Punica granatum TaxID=22663 RepID=A0A218W5W9_PUNGR|nr:hypothetical protein CDL15_Pgr004756 [Punica granatum]
MKRKFCFVKENHGKFEGNLLPRDFPWAEDIKTERKTKKVWMAQGTEAHSKGRSVWVLGFLWHDCVILS